MHTTVYTAPGGDHWHLNPECRYIASGQNRWDTSDVPLISHTPGTPNYTVPAWYQPCRACAGPDPSHAVRAHITALRQQGMTVARIAEQAVVDTNTIIAIHAGRSRPIPHTAQAILAVRPLPVDVAALPPRTLVVDIGTGRRLHALVAAGLPEAYLASRLGRLPNNMPRLLRNTRVYARTALEVRALYGELWLTDPMTLGIDPQDSARARARAASRGWAPPGAWDEDSIDDPDAVPEWTGRCGTVDGYRDHGRLHIPICPPCSAARAESRQDGRRTAPAAVAA